MPTLAPHAEHIDRQRELHHLERRIAEQHRAIATQEQLLAILHGKRDKLVSQLTDLDGAHDRRRVAVR